ncbi:MAG: ribonuclease Z [Nanoarchaeota archaeon]|nr:ribonuclease Z [Nanoarchaeota archaeon]
MFEIIFLGTSSGIPTKTRNHASVYVRRKGDYFLFDIGEGTQRQMKIAGVSPMRVNDLFITHWHGDHVLGLGGFLSSCSLEDRATPLMVYGPEGTKKSFEHYFKAIPFKLNFEIKIKEVVSEKPVIIKDSEDYVVKAVNVRHGVPTLAFSIEEKPRRRINLEYTKKFGLTQHPLLGKLQRGKDIEYKGKKISVEKGTILVPGKKFVYVGDSGYCKELEDFVKDSDLLICESTFSEETAKKARSYNHLTAGKAAWMAKKQGVKRLILTHFSRRFASTRELEKEARKEFDNVVMAKDFMKIEMK